MKLPRHTLAMAANWYALCRAILRYGFFPLKGGFRAVDPQNLPKEGGVIVAPIHLSYLDPPAVAAAAMHRELSFMAKEELFTTKISGLIRSLNAFPVRRGESDTEAIRKTLVLLAEGRAVLVFPEGTRGDGVQMNPINKGVTLLARRSGATVVPVAIIGSNVVMPRQGKGRRHRITVAFGPGLRYDEFAAGDERAAREGFADELARRLQALCAENGLPLKSALSTEAKRTSAASETASENPVP